MDTQIQADEDPAPGAVAEGTPSDATTRATPVSTLLREIARAMQTAAKRERERIDAGMGVEETAQVEKIHARAADEAAALRTGADDDVELVNAWCVDETRRIREEADRRIEERRSRLEQSNTQHGSLIEAEIESVHVAVQDYRDSLGAFFGRLADEPDPSGIARLAGTLPEPPDLDEARADARSKAMKAIEVQAAAEPLAPTDETPPDAGAPTDEQPLAATNETPPDVDARVPIDELVPVMDPTADQRPGWAATAPTIPGDHQASAVAQPDAMRPPKTWWLGRSSR